MKLVAPVLKIFRMFKLIALVLQAFMLMPAVTWGNVYRCVSDDGTVRFSDQPCAGNAELLLEEEGCNIDESIRKANPLMDLTAQSEDINDRLVSHARKLGECMLPNETYRSYNVSEHRFRDLDHTWEITVDFGEREGKVNWSLVFYYNEQARDRNRRIRMDAIFVELKQRRRNLPILESIPSLNRRATGKYSVQLQ